MASLFGIRKSQFICDALKYATAIFGLVFHDSFLYQWKIDGVNVQDLKLTVCNDSFQGFIEISVFT